VIASTNKQQVTFLLPPALFAEVTACVATTGITKTRVMTAAIIAYFHTLTDAQRTDAIQRAVATEVTHIVKRRAAAVSAVPNQNRDRNGADQ
jgi:hypothetical protein